MINWVQGVIAPHIIKRRYSTLCEIGSSTGATSDKLLELTKVSISIVDPCLDVDLGNKHKDNNRVRVYRGLSLQVLPKLSEKFDCILIDGDHNWFTVFNELNTIDKKGLLNKGGTIFFHDVGWQYGRRDMYYLPDSIPSEYRHPYSRKGIIKGQSELSDDFAWPHDVAIFEGGARNGVLTAIEDFVKQHKQDYGFFCLQSEEAGLGVLWRKDGPLPGASFLIIKIKFLLMFLRKINVPFFIRLLTKTAKAMRSDLYLRLKEMFSGRGEGQ
jgi:hypothetical protein